MMGCCIIYTVPPARRHSNRSSTQLDAAGIPQHCQLGKRFVTTLLSIARRHRGKVSDKWESYFSTYEALFQPLRTKPISLLEIGVQNGGSLEIWARYLPHA